jgi:hypothetical protein
LQQTSARLAALLALSRRSSIGSANEMSCVLFVPIHHSVIETPIDRGLSPGEATDPKAIRRELRVVLLQ